MNRAIVKFGEFLDQMMSKILREDIDCSYEEEDVKIVSYSTKSIFPNEVVRNKIYSEAAK